MPSSCFIGASTGDLFVAIVAGNAGDRSLIVKLIMPLVMPLIVHAVHPDMSGQHS